VDISTLAQLWRANTWPAGGSSDRHAAGPGFTC
jgi:hypothetical protein